jgi:hypothetical protein
MVCARYRSACIDTCHSFFSAARRGRLSLLLNAIVTSDFGIKNALAKEFASCSIFGLGNLCITRCPSSWDKVYLSRSAGCSSLRTISGKRPGTVTVTPLTDRACPFYCCGQIINRPRRQQPMRAHDGCQSLNVPAIVFWIESRNIGLRRIFDSLQRSPGGVL